MDLQLLSPHHGDVLNRHDGVETSILSQYPLRAYDSVPEGMEFMIRSLSPDRIIRKFLGGSLCLW